MSLQASSFLKSSTVLQHHVREKKQSRPAQLLANLLILLISSYPPVNLENSAVPAVFMFLRDINGFNVFGTKHLNDFYRSQILRTARDIGILMILFKKQSY